MHRETIVERAKRALPKLSLAALVVSMVGCDHATKHAASVHLSARSPVELMPGILDLRYTENRDTAFSLLSHFGIERMPRALGALAFAVLCALLFMWWQRRREARRLEHVGFALAVAGAVGNVADRILRGYVVDFIHVHAWPVFNVADILIAVGVCLMISQTFVRPSTQPRSRVGSSVPWTRAF